MLAHDDNFHLGKFLPESIGCFQAILNRHADVQKDYVGAKFPRFLQYVRTIHRLAADFETSLGQ